MERGSAVDYYEQEGIGSVTSLSNASGTLDQTYTYSFGNTTNSTGSLTNFLRYTGREFDTETSLYYYRARYYDALAGRFLSEDQIGSDEGVNLYVYVGNSPILRRDPTGFFSVVGFPPDLATEMRNAVNNAIKRLTDSCPSCAGPNGPKIARALQKATFVYQPDLPSCGFTQGPVHPNTPGGPDDIEQKCFGCP